MTKQLIKQVYKNRGNKQKLVTIPKKSEIEEGDYVSIKKVKDEND